MTSAQSETSNIICKVSHSRWTMLPGLVGPHLPHRHEIRAWVHGHQLTDDERAVQDLIADGRRPTEIANILAVEPERVWAMLQAIASKTDAAMPSNSSV